jgi:hypothetical protein
VIVTQLKEAKMQDPTDTKSMSLSFDIQPKKRGRPASGKARTAAQRKSEQLARTRTKINTTDEPLTDAECLYVLSASAWPAGSAIDRDAFMQLGRLRGYLPPLSQQLDDDQEEMPPVAAISDRSNPANLDEYL